MTKMLKLNYRETASSEFELTNLEKNMIKNHMFPTTPAVPKYLESWIVCFVDKCVATKEFSFKFKVNLGMHTIYLCFL